MSGIIKDQRIYYSYSHETVNITDNITVNFAVPIVSLSDLPFSEIGSYILDPKKSKELRKDIVGRYGDYTIGLSKEWGYRNKFNPVWYCDKGSDALANINEQMKLIYRIKSTDKDDKRLVEMINRLWLNLCFIKNSEGRLENKRYARYRFYDEREYRKVAPMKELQSLGYRVILMDSPEQREEVKKLKSVDSSIDSNYLLTYEKFKSAHNESSILKHELLSVPFEWSDVKYIIVKDKDKKNNVITQLIGNRILNLSNLLIPVFTIDEVLCNVLGENHNVDLDKG